jgi:drug/metabolite transporter (DMT)-like permease
MREPDRPQGTPFIVWVEAIILPLIFGSTVVLAKLALADLGPLTLTTLRFVLAALVLLPFALRRHAVPDWPRSLWLRLIVMGISFYVIGNGSLFLGLRFIPATTAALLLGLTPLVVLVLGGLWLHEVPSKLQLVAVAVCIGGSFLFFSHGVAVGEPLGIVIVAIGLLGSAVFTIMGRELARRQTVDTVSLTAIPVAVGALILIPISVVAEGLPRFSAQGWGIAVVLALLNTVGALLLYNHLLRFLTALQVTAIMNVNPLVTAGLAWVVLGNRLGALQVLAMVVVLVSVFAVQVGGLERDATEDEVSGGT